MADSLQGIGDVATTQLSTAQLSGKLSSTGNIDAKAKDFESMFMTQMLQPMFESVETNKMFGGGHGEDVMKTFLVQEYGKLASQGGKLGIATAVKAEMLRAQAAASAAKSSPATVGGSYASVN